MIEYNEGIHLKGTGLWFDSKKKAGLSFISNANIDKFIDSLDQQFQDWTQKEQNGNGKNCK